MRVEDLQKKLDARFGEGLTVRREDRTIIVSGEMDNWHDIVTACSMCVSREKGVHVVNDIHLAGVEMPKMRRRCGCPGFMIRRSMENIRMF